jgi:hypothetical protein
MHAINPFEEISFDGLGPYLPLATGGYGRAIIGICCCTLFTIGQLIKIYDGSACVAFLTAIIEFAGTFGFKIRRCRFDAGRIEGGDGVTTFLLAHQIIPCPAPTEYQNQNPVERTFETIKNSLTACLMDQTTLDAKHWGHE